MIFFSPRTDLKLSCRPFPHDLRYLLAAFFLSGRKVFLFDALICFDIHILDTPFSFLWMLAFYS